MMLILRVNKLIIFGVLFFLFNAAYANVGSDLNKFFNDLGFNNNITTPKAFTGQEAGYYTGGSIFARTPVRDLQIMQIDVPGYRSGCGGIDLFMGGFSFIKGDQLIQVLKNVMNNAAGYAFTLALETATPQLANVMKYLQKAAGEINAMNINSCETAVGLVGSVWPRTQEAQRNVCRDVAFQNNVFSDYASAKQGCGNQGRLTSTLNGSVGAYKNAVFKEGNIAWKAIQQNAFLNADQTLAELFMSLSGTIIVKQKGGGDDAEHTFSDLPSLSTNPALLGALLNGGTATIYKCDEKDNCLAPTKTIITISSDHALRTQVSKTLQKMAEKFYSDTRLLNTEIGLMEATTLPIQKMLNVQMAFYKDGTVLDISSYSDIIAIDILFQYLNENLNTIRASTINLQYPEDIMSKFTKGIDTARKALRSVQKSVYAELTTTNSIIKQTKMIEDLLSSNFSEHMNMTMKWSKGEL
jgi:conjugative transfer pilus assembly protein TraH